MHSLQTKVIKKKYLRMVPHIIKFSFTFETESFSIHVTGNIHFLCSLK